MPRSSSVAARCGPTPRRYFTGLFSAIATLRMIVSRTRLPGRPPAYRDLGEHSGLAAKIAIARHTVLSNRIVHLLARTLPRFVRCALCTRRRNRWSIISAPGTPSSGRELNSDPWRAHMKRRDFLWSAGIVSAGLPLLHADSLFAMDVAPTGWRTFEVTTRVEVLKPSGTTRIWVPAALISRTPFQKTLSNSFAANGGTAKILKSKTDSLGIIAAAFPSGAPPVLTVTSRVATKNIAVDLSAPGRASHENQADLDHFLQPTKLLPTDGIVKETAITITSGSKTDVEKARAIYEWIVEN